MDNLLIIFVKNPQLGRVKTRLARSIGDEKALAIYFKLLTHTHNVAHKVQCDKAIYYSEFIDTEDQWPNSDFKKYRQQGADLGEKMYNAIAEGLGLGYKKVVLIGSDIYELKAEIIQEAFSKLDTTDVVLGPATDGGYYLIGMKAANSQVFNISQWSTPAVCETTIRLVTEQNLSYELVTMLNDVDEIEDLNGTDLMTSKNLP